MKTLCVYCTRSGTSKKIAEKLSNELDAELLFITNGKSYKSVFGYISAAVTGLKSKLPEILPYKSKLPIGEYDRIILVAPIWCEDVCPLAKRFLTENSGKINGKLYYVINHMSDISYEDKILKLDKLSATQNSGFISLKTHKCDFLKDSEKIFEILDNCT